MFEGLIDIKVYGGICNYHLEQYEEALKHYNYALKDPDNENEKDKDGKDKKIIKKVEILYNKGLSEACLMMFEDAIRDYETAKEEAKENASQKLMFKIRF